jgi:ankyrin repeat protein
MGGEPSALIEAVKAGDAAAVAALLARNPGLAAARDESGLPALLVAVYHRQPAIADALAAATGELDALQAAALGRVDDLRARLAADPQAIAARSPDGFTPLHLASFFGGAAAVQALLDAGAPPDADAENALRVRPLHSAAAACDRDAVRALLEAGANPNVGQRGGWTPLHSAAHLDDEEMARLLLDHGADPTLTADDGRDPAAMAADDGSARVQALLAVRGA